MTVTDTAATNRMNFYRVRRLPQSLTVDDSVGKLVRIAKIKNAANPLQWLKDLLASISDQDISNGKVLISYLHQGKCQRC